MGKHSKPTRTRRALRHAAVAGASAAVASIAAVAAAPAAAAPITSIPADQHHAVLEAFRTTGTGASGSTAATGDTNLISKAALYRARTAALKAAVQPAAYTVHAGDSLSLIAQHAYGKPGAWPALWWVNRNRVRNPNLISTGQRLVLPASPAASASVVRAADAAIAPAPAVRYAPRHAATAAVVTVSGPPRDKFDGHRGPCGDGDKDGMDAQCWQVGLAPAPGTVTVVHSVSSDSGDGDGSTTVVHSVSSDSGDGEASSSSGGYTPRHSYHHSYSSGASYSAGSYSYSGLESLWISAGGPSWAASHAASIAECESGGNASAYNPSGATGLWQILGAVVPGNLDNAYTNALNAVSKFKASGDTFAQWVCQ